MSWPRGLLGFSAHLSLGLNAVPLLTSVNGRETIVLQHQPSIGGARMTIEIKPVEDIDTTTHFVG